MQLLANYRQTALEQMQSLVALSQMEVIARTTFSFRSHGH
jgi:hypothetical protein